MKFLQLLLSLCLAFLLCAVPLIRAQEVPPIPTAAPTPPNGEPGSPNGPGGPPAAPATVDYPQTSILYPGYAG